MTDISVKIFNDQQNIDSIFYVDCIVDYALVAFFVGELSLNHIKWYFLLQKSNLIRVSSS